MIPVQELLRVRANSTRHIYPDNSFRLDEAAMLEAAADEIDRLNALLAQRIEHQPSKLGVDGSNPSERTTALAAQQDVREAETYQCISCGRSYRIFKHEGVQVVAVECLCGERTTEPVRSDEQ